MLRIATAPYMPDNQTKAKINMPRSGLSPSAMVYTTYPSSFSIPNISSPRPRYESQLESPTLPTKSRTSYKYLSSTTPYRVFKNNLRKACRRSGNRITPYHPYRPNDKKLWTIYEIEEDVYHMELESEEKRLRIYGGEGLGFLLGTPSTVNSRTSTPLYQLPSAAASSDILGVPSPNVAAKALEGDLEGSEMEVLVEEEKRLSWSSGSGSDGSGKLATPAMDCEDPFGLGRLLVTSPKGIPDRHKPFRYSPSPRRILDYTTLPLPPIPTRPPCTPPRPIYRPPTPPRPSPSKRCVSAPTPPTRPPRPRASQLPPPPLLATRYPREPRRPPPLNLSISTRHQTRYDLGLGPHPFVNTDNTRPPTALLPPVEIKSPRAYRIAKLADTDLPTPYTSPRITQSKTKHTIDVDLLSALDRLVNECGEGDIDMDMEVDYHSSDHHFDSDSSSLIHAFPLPPTRDTSSSATTPISASSTHLQTPITPPQHHTRLPLMPMTRGDMGVGMGKKRALSTGPRSDHSFLRSLASPTPSGCSVGSGSSGSAGSEGSMGRGLPRRKGLPEGWTRF